MASKQEMLDRVRAALGRDKSGSAPAQLAPFTFAAEAITQDEMTARFSSELERVSGRVSRVESPEAVKAYLENLMPDEQPATVAVSDAAEFRDFQLREWLARRGSRVVATLKEFALAEKANQNLQAHEQAMSDAEVFENYKRTLLASSIGVTTADYGIADTGTLVIVSGAEQHRLISLVPPVHVCLLDSKQIVASLAELLARVQGRFNSQAPAQAMTFITGPSRTADIELSLTLGVHGPRELHVLLY